MTDDRSRVFFFFRLPSSVFRLLPANLLIFLKFVLSIAINVLHLHPHCGVEQWQLVGLITQRSEVRILPPLHRKSLAVKRQGFFIDSLSKCLHLERMEIKKPIPRESMEGFSGVKQPKEEREEHSDEQSSFFYPPTPQMGA